MKKIILILVLLLSFTSCATTTIHDDMYDTVVDTGVSYTTVITYGTPYYYDGVISYYLYRGWYYYPYRWHDCWYLHPFRHVRPAGYRFVPRHDHKPHPHLGYEPHRRGYNPPHRSTHNNGYNPPRGTDRGGMRPLPQKPSTPAVRPSRPSVQRTPVTRSPIQRAPVQHNPIHRR